MATLFAPNNPPFIRGVIYYQHSHRTFVLVYIEQGMFVLLILER